MRTEKMQLSPEQLSLSIQRIVEREKIYYNNITELMHDLETLSNPFEKAFVMSSITKCERIILDLEAERAKLLNL